MKLELKHLAPYLPYGLRVTYIHRIGDKKELVHKQSIDRVFMDYGYLNLHTEPYSKQAPIIDYLLELRPLSDLTKEEYQYIWELETDEESVSQWIDLDTWSQQTCKWSYDLWSTLFEKHFDVFGLIDKGLAIDINTL